MAKKEETKMTTAAKVIKTFDNKFFIVIVAIVIVLAFWLILRVTKYSKVATLEDGKDIIISLEVDGKKVNFTADDLYLPAKEKYGNSIMLDLIDEAVIGSKYELDETEKAEITKNLQDIKDQYPDNYMAALQYYFGASSEADATKVLTLDKKRNKAVNEFVKSSITDKEIKKYYDDNIIGDINAKHILISPNKVDGMTTEEETVAWDEALKTANEVLAKLKKGEDWTALAKEYSDDEATASKGGDLGWFNKDDMVKEFEEAVIKLTKGKYTTAPVKTTYGYHIIYKIDTKEKPELDNIKDDIIDTLTSEKLNADTKLQHTALISLRKDAKLSFEDGNLLKQYEDYLNQINNLN